MNDAKKNLKKLNILILFGGGGSEHEVSRVSADYLYQIVESIPNLNPILVEVDKDAKWLNQKRPCSLIGQVLKTPTEQPYIDFIIPCFHGAPGETGQIQGLFENNSLPYLGQGAEASITCFNKVLTKLLLDHIKLQNSPWISAHSNIELDEKSILDFFDKHKDLFIKAASQGSSVGCFHVTKREEVIEKVKEAFQYSDHVLIEKTIKGRELEISVFEYENEILASKPGEIICPDGFYNYEQKYSKESKTNTQVIAQGVSEDITKKMQSLAIKAFKYLGLRHLSRVDFFLTTDNQIYLNEINTFPGLTPISMFPKMLEKRLEDKEVGFKEYLNSIIVNETKKQKGLE